MFLAGGPYVTSLMRPLNTKIHWLVYLLVTEALRAVLPIVRLHAPALECTLDVDAGLNLQPQRLQAEEGDEAPCNLFTNCAGLSVPAWQALQHKPQLARPQPTVRPLYASGSRHWDPFCAMMTGVSLTLAGLPALPSPVGMPITTSP